jgi:hypothetical protein
LFRVRQVDLRTREVEIRRRRRRRRRLPRMPGRVNGKAGGAAAAGVHPRYVPERGQVLKGVLGALFGCFRAAKTQPLPR